MVVKTLTKQSFLSIKKTFKRFLSILAIVLLGVGFFTGIRQTSPNMEESVDEYFKKQNVYDINLISTWGITKDEIKKIYKESNLFKHVVIRHQSEWVHKKYKESDLLFISAAKKKVKEEVIETIDYMNEYYDKYN